MALGMVVTALRFFERFTSNFPSPTSLALFSASFLIEMQKKKKIVFSLRNVQTMIFHRAFRKEFPNVRLQAFPKKKKCSQLDYYVETHCSAVVCKKCSFSSRCSTEKLAQTSFVTKNYAAGNVEKSMTE